MISVQTTGRAPRIGLQPIPVKFSALSRDERIDLHLAKTHQPAFQQAFIDTLDRARQALQKKLAGGGKGFVVLDVDDTALDNRGFFEDPQRQYYKKWPSPLKNGWEAWVNRAKTPAIPTTKRFIEWLNQTGIPYAFLTGIKQNVQTASMQNLQNEGLIGPHCLGGFYAPENISTKDFKQNERPRLEKQFGMPIWASIGDMQRDMTGNPDVDFLLPGYTEALRKENDHG